MPDLAQRFAENPILRPEDLQPSRPELEIAGLFNPGVFEFKGKTWLAVRVAERPLQKNRVISIPVLDPAEGVKILEFDRKDPKLDTRDLRVIRYDGRDYLTTLSHLRLVSSTDGIHFVGEAEYPPLTGEGRWESYGLEDCRVTLIEGTFHLTYTAVSPEGVAVGYRSTRDWKSFSQSQLIFPPHNKDCTFFPGKIGGRYYALHRPSSPLLGGNHIWVAESFDLQHWGNHRCLAPARPGSWDGDRVGAGAAPIWTPEGWLEIYHGALGDRYCLGLLLLDLEEPWRVRARSTQPVMEPSAPYEKNGFFGKVVFTNGHRVDGDTVTLYYGASDSVICGATFSLSALLRSLEGF